ncbi:MAG TPA: hypothetical protein VF799_05195 [Geobacteraceae bacterium]
MKKVLALVVASTLLATSAMADEPVTSKFKMSIGGYVKLDYAYNSDNLGSNGFITPGGAGLSAALTEPAGTRLQEQSILGMKQSRLWVKVDGPTFFGAKTGALIEGDFYGDNGTAAESPQFRMRLGYGTIDWTNTSILFGQYWDMFAPMVASTQDFRSGATTGAPNNPRSPMIKLTQRVNLNADNQLQFVFGVTDPTQYGDNQGGAVTLAQPVNAYGAGLAYAAQMFYTTKALGTAPGYFGLSNQPFKVGFFGQYSNEHLKVSNTKAVDTWGYGAYLFSPILKSADGKGRAMTMSFEGQVYEAANMNYNGATAAQFANGTTNLTATAAQTVAGIMPRKDLGFAAQLIFYPTQDLGLTAGFGDRVNANKAADMGAALYQKYNQELYLNVAYDLNAAVRVAAEYQNMEAGFNNDFNGAYSAAGAKGIASVNIARVCLYYFF